VERTFLEVKFIKEKINYDGSQLSPHWIYKTTGIMGDAAVSFIGACNVTPEHMIDMEDLIAGDKIASDLMLHFIIEIFNKSAFEGAVIQCVMVSEIHSVLLENNINVKRIGDDLFVGDAKLSISIATASAVSALIHIALNITNDGTPVKTCALNDFKINAASFAEQCLQKIKKEYSRLVLAASKVRPAK